MINIISYFANMNQQPTPQSLKLRMAQIKSEWPTYVSYTKFYEKEYGKLSEDEITHIQQVWNLRIADQKIINRFDSLASTLKHS